jgi:spoIIIJ-associated protein
MKSIDVEEKTVDNAINKALEQLQVSRDQVSVEILEEGSRGLFGIVGARPAKVRVSVSQGIPSDVPKENVQAVNQTEPLFQNQKIRPKEEAPSEPVDIENVQLDANVQQIVTTAKHTLQEILQKLEIEYTVDVKKRDDQILLNIHCENENFLIGRRGATLDAIQYLVNRIANKHATEKVQVVLDTSDYRVNRKQRLQRLALRLSKRVKMTGKPVTVSPMNPHDRRIIHLALQDDPAVKTLSKGTGFMRRVMITASKNSNRNRRR